MSTAATAVILGSTAVSLYGASQTADAYENAAETSAAAAIEAAQIAYDAQVYATDASIAAAKEATEESVAAAKEANNTAIAAIIKANELADKAVKEGADESNAEFQAAYDSIKNQLSPWIKTGEAANQKLADLTGLNGSEAATNALVTDPSYQWRLDQGQQALERSAAATGELFSGKTGAALTDYAQGAASQEYQAAFDRLMSLSTQGQSSATTLAGYQWNLGSEKSTNAWNVSNQTSASAYNEANTRSQGAWNVANAQAGGSQNEANVAASGYQNNANAAANQANTTAQAESDVASAYADSENSYWSSINSALNSAISAGTTVYGISKGVSTFGTNKKTP